MTPQDKAARSELIRNSDCQRKDFLAGLGQGYDAGYAQAQAEIELLVQQQVTDCAVLERQRDEWRQQAEKLREALSYLSSFEPAEGTSAFCVKVLAEYAAWKGEK